MKEKIYNILLQLLMKVAKSGTVIVSMTYEEYHEYLEFKNNVFIVYENEQSLKTDWPDAKEIIKKCTKDQILKGHHVIDKGEKQ